MKDAHDKDDFHNLFSGFLSRCLIVFKIANIMPVVIMNSFSGGNISIQKKTNGAPVLWGLLATSYEAKIA